MSKIDGKIYKVLVNENLENLIGELSERDIRRDYNLISIYYDSKYHTAILEKRVIEEYL